uniref:Uncharacterized protein n=1 Tax=Arundo donax TaxID=35708 RepID=A0A0A9FUI3_ARUDO
MEGLTTSMPQHQLSFRKNVPLLLCCVPVLIASKRSSSLAIKSLSVASLLQHSLKVGGHPIPVHQGQK